MFSIGVDIYILTQFYSLQKFVALNDVKKILGTSEIFYHKLPSYLTN